ncbi:MAG: glycosyltransferase family 2 protein [Chloroflexota bacterium]
MKLSVIVATMDRPSYLERTIASLRAGRVQPHELLVADDSRGPETRELVEGWSSRWPAVRYLETEKRGTSAARNLGARAASGDLLLITDDDCIVQEDCVGRLIEGFEADPEAACVTGRVLPYGDARGKVAVAVSGETEPREWRGKARPWGIGHSSNISFRREEYHRIGGFDEEMGPGTKLYAAEDLDVLYRVLKAGGKVVYRPEAVIYHDQWRTRSQARKRRADYARGTAAFLLKHAILHRDGFALRMMASRLWQDVPLLALIGLSKRNLELELVSLYQAKGLLAGMWVAGRFYVGKRVQGVAR